MCVRPSVDEAMSGDSQQVQEWKRFTPDEVSTTHCMARIWGGGKGGQCKSKPAANSDFCAAHTKKECWRTHGRCDGPIPEKKFQQFLKESGKPPKPEVAQATTPSPKKKRDSNTDTPASPDAPKKLIKRKLRDVDAKKVIADAAIKDVARPKRPAGGAFGVYLAETRREIVASMPAGHKMGDVPKAVSAKWQALTDDERLPYKSKYVEKLATYRSQMAEFKKKHKFRRGIKVKDPNRPKVPAGGAYGVFFAEKRAEIKQSLPADHKMTDVAKAASVWWKKLGDEEKVPFKTRYEEKFATYKTALVEYKAARPESDKVDHREAAVPTEKVKFTKPGNPGKDEPFMPLKKFRRKRAW